MIQWEWKKKEKNKKKNMKDENVSEIEFDNDANDVKHQCWVLQSSFNLKIKK